VFRLSIKGRRDRGAIFQKGERAFSKKQSEKKKKRALKNENNNDNNNNNTYEPGPSLSS